MKKSIKTLLMAATIVVLPFSFTSCNEFMDSFFGEWDKPAPTVTLEIESSNLVMSIGESVLRVASTNSSDNQITYSSSKPSVATVSQDGKVTAMSEGETIITVSLQDATASCKYKVVVKNVSAKALNDVDKATPLTLVAAEDGKITIYFKNGITLSNDIKYTINGGSEQTISKNTEGSYDIVVSKGDVVQLYSTNTSLGGGGGGAGARSLTRGADESAKYINIRTSMKTEVYGNVMSLLSGKDNLEKETEIKGKNAFYGLFDGADKLVSSENRELVLPATTLKEGCYENMFSGCKGIEKAPELPANKCEKNCYKGMFSDCSKVSSFKILATETAEGCIDGIMTNAGTEAETPPVLLLDENADKNYFEQAIPSNIKIGVAVSSITLDPTELTLTVGETATLKATLDPVDPTDKNLEWSSSNKTAASINPDGLSESLEAIVTAVSVGTTTITVCTPDGTVSATCKLTVEALPVVVPSYYKVYVYGEDPTAEPPFKPGAWDAAAMRFNSLEAPHFRWLTDEEYFDLKTLVFDVSDVSEDFDLRVMNGWWSNTYYDHVKWTNGLNELKLTEEMAKECAWGSEGRDLDLMLLEGSCTINAVYYLEEGELVPAESLWVQPTASEYYDSGSTFSNSVRIMTDIMPKNTKKSLKWTTNNPDVADVVKDGVFKIKGVGVATVTATTTDGTNLSGNCVVTVKPLGGIFYSNYNSEIININKTPGASPFVQPLRISGNVTSVTYTSSDESIATVNASTGEVTISSNAPVGKSVMITATATVPEEDEYIYPEWSMTSRYTIMIVAPTSQGGRDNYGPGSW